MEIFFGMAKNITTVGNRNNDIARQQKLHCYFDPHRYFDHYITALSVQVHMYLYVQITVLHNTIDGA